jgi:hypothetical protein
MKLALLNVFLLSAGGAVASESAPGISMTGFDQVRVGLSAAALERTLGNSIDPPYDEDEASCRYALPEDLYPGIGFMLLDGRLARLDVDETGIPTLSGASVGDSQASVIALYGPKLKVTNHFYTGPEGKYLTLFSKDDRFGIRFETDGTRVTRYYVGTSEAIQYVEGCE